MEMTIEFHTDKEQFTEGETVENVQAMIRNGEENKKTGIRRECGPFGS